MSQQLVTAHLLSSPVDTNEIRGFLLERVAAGSLPAAGTAGRVRFANSGAPALISGTNTGLGPVYDDGVGWRRFSAPFVNSEVYEDFPLLSGKILVGNVSNKMAAVTPSTVPLNYWGAAAGDVSMGGFKITNLATPAAGTDAANKQYVLDVVSGSVSLAPAKLKSNQALTGTWTYSTVGKTLTRSSGTTALVSTEIDSAASGAYAYTLLVNDRILVNDQATASHNGVYTVTNIGGGTNAVLTRTTDCDTNTELTSPFIFVSDGSFAGSGYQQNSTAFDITVPSGTITFVQVSDTTGYTAGKGIEFYGTQIHFFSYTGWATGDLFYGASSGTLARRAVGANGTFLQALSALPSWSAYAMPLSGTGYDVLAFNSTGTAMVPVTNRAADKVMITDSSGVTNWSTALPNVTIGGKTPFYTTDTIPITKGGTGVDNTSGAVGGIAYRNTTSQIVLGTAPGTKSSYFAIWNPASTGNVEYFDLWAAAITWTGIHTHLADVLAIATDASIGNISLSPQVSLQSNRNDGGVITNSRWMFQATSSTTPSVGGPLQLWHSTHVGGTPNQSTQFAFNSEDHPSYPGGFMMWKGNTIGTVGGYLLFFNNSGETYLPPGPSADYATHYSTAPTPPGLPYRIAALELYQFWTGKQTLTRVLAADEVFGTRQAGATPPGTRDANDRFTMLADGKHSWGPGNTAVDVHFARSGVGALTLTGGLTITGTLTVSGGVTFTGIVPLASGGTGANLTAAGATGGVAFKASGTALGATGAGISGSILRSAAAGTPTWTAYSLPSAAFSASGALLASTSTTAMGELIGAADTVTRFLTSTNRVLAYTAAFTNPARDAAGGIARVYKSRIQGTGAAASFDITHNFATRDVMVMVRKGVATEDDVTGYDQVITSCQVRTTNMVRIQFGYNPTASEYFVVTIVG